MNIAKKPTGGQHNLRAMNLFVSIDGDDIGRVVGLATLEDDVEKIRKINQDINRGNEIWKSFAENCGGSVIEAGGDEVRLEIPASAIDQIPKFREQYATAVGATVSVGVGLKLSESAKALLVAKLRGKDRIIFWSPEFDKEIESAKQNPEPSQKKIVSEYLGKGAYRSEPSKQQPKMSGEHSEAQSLYQMIDENRPPPQPEMTHAEADAEKHFHKLAQAQGKQDMDEQSNKAKNHDDLRNQVAQILQSVKQQAPILAQIKQTAPDTYGSIMRLVQGVIAMARELSASTARVPGNDGGSEDTNPKVSKSEEPFEKMAVSDIPIGKRVRSPEGTEHFDYSHVLPKELKNKGYKVYIAHDDVTNDFGGHVFATVHHGKAEVGHISGDYRKENRSISPGMSEMDPEYRGKGLGTAMYEALFAHGKNFLEATTVEGGRHSTAAHAVHEKLAQKHGMQYQAAREHFGPQKDFDSAYSPYNYQLKSELVKMALKDIPIGLKVSGARSAGGNPKAMYDYSHVLPDKKKYKMVLHDTHMGATNILRARLHHTPNGEKPSQDNDIGYVSGRVHSDNDGKYLHTTFSQLDPEHRGKGLGLAAYEALMAHAKNKHHANEVQGDDHSTLAHKVHSKLAAKHGMEYVAEAQEPAPGGGLDDDNDPRSFDEAFGAYRYTLKAEMEGHSELDPSENPDAKPPGVLEKETKSAHRNLNLPVGTELNGKIKVAHIDGSSSFKQMRAGKILSQDPAIHATSSREPGAR